MQARLVMHLLRWIALGAISRLLAGAASYVVLEVLDRATEVRLDHAWLLYRLPIAGLVVGATYSYLGGPSSGGNSMLIEEIHEPTDWIPRRLAPLVLVGTVNSHQ